MIRTYGYPDVGSYGLAHSMLAWGRCQVWCNRHGAPMLAPNWLHLQHRIGPWLRHERDKRQYQLLFRFPNHVTGLRRAWMLARLPRVDATTLKDDTPVDLQNPQLIVFTNRLARNFQTHFHEIVGHGDELKRALRDITKPKHLPKPVGQPHVAIHVRLGDFTVQASEAALRAGTGNSQIPVNWYAAMLKRLREGLGREVPALVYSDGSDEALSPLLGMAGVERAPRGSAVTDMLGISDGSVMISSGSGFSVWGGFLGSLPRICFPGQRLVRTLPVSGAVELEPEVDFAQDIPAEFLGHVSHAFE